mgnify:CR=1 FL=1
MKQYKITKYTLYDSGNNNWVIDDETNEALMFNTYLEALKECRVNETIVKVEM